MCTWLYPRAPLDSGKEVVASSPGRAARGQLRNWWSNSTEDFCMPEQTTMPMKREDTAPRRWDPFEMFETLQEEMDRFWRRPSPFWAGAVPSFFRRGAGQGMAWAPRMDVFEKDNNLIVKADLPGLKNEDVQVELDDGGLVIRGKSKSETEAKEENYYRMERSVGTFYRRLPL